MNDPFILLMEDHLDIGDRSVGGPHPHAGFETVTLILDGAIFDRDEGGILNPGEVQVDDRGQRHYSQRRRQDQRKGPPASTMAPY
jgi:redox-sensitive bicupin YhaK (pirin superfamily)